MPYLLHSNQLNNPISEKIGPTSNR